jgi:hypothetical protein
MAEAFFVRGGFWFDLGAQAGFNAKAAGTHLFMDATPIHPPSIPQPTTKICDLCVGKPPAYGIVAFFVRKYVRMSRLDFS